MVTDVTGSSQSAAVTFVPGDADGDNEVTIIDYLSLSEHYEKNQTLAGWWTPDARGISPQMVDFDDDGEVSILDYVALSTAYGQKGDEL